MWRPGARTRPPLTEARPDFQGDRDLVALVAGLGGRGSQRGELEKPAICTSRMRERQPGSSGLRPYAFSRRNGGLRGLRRRRSLREPGCVPPILVCRTAWMDFYDGLRLGADKPKGGGAYVQEKGFGHEIFNFRREADGKYRGYVRPPGSTMGSATVEGQRLNISKLGAGTSADRIHGVTVFWVATNPVLGGTRIVGWYDDATVFREWRPSPSPRPLPNGHDAGFMIEATKGHLVSPSDDRVYVIPRATSSQTGIGQSNVWYPSPELGAKLLAYPPQVIPGASLKSTPAATQPKVKRASDTDARLRVERAAMDAVIKWCEARALPWSDVSLQKLGWDIQAGEGKQTLRIEVKGSSSPIGDTLLELTPNEFAKMTSEEHRDRYRLAVVSVQGTSTKLVMFAWSHEADAWVGDGLTLVLHQVMSARVEIIRPSTK